MKQSLNPLAVAGILVAALAIIGLILFRATSQPTPPAPAGTLSGGATQPTSKFRP